jgi:ATP-dependent DNA ligase
MGRLPLPRLPRRQGGRPALQIGAAARALFSGCRRADRAARAQALRARRRAGHRQRGPARFRGAADPAASRVAKLAAAKPASYILFDLLVERGRSLVDLPLAERRPRLEEFVRSFEDEGIHLSPAARNVVEARSWCEEVGEALDGLIAKRLDEPYRSGDREGAVKWKRLKTADCVVGGFRYGTNSELVGSLLLGLYDEEGLLNHVGYTSTISAKDRPALTRKLESLRKPPGFTGRAPGGPSRWSTERSGEWEPLAPKLVVEVRFDHVSGGRFRHGTALLRWRPDKAPKHCTMDQILPQGSGGIETLLQSA